MEKFKIFYSWQSDLPGSTTRNFIRACIDEAIDLAQESEAIEAERDEATTGTTGSPNIVTTLFSKIDDCDLFIADLSLCYTEDQAKEKKSPNPNVLLELGYAVKTLSWERVICLCNTDFGDKYPFDIAHNRITGFSLDGKSKKEVKADIAKIIFTNIRDLRKQTPRAKAGRATHIMGTYDFELHMVTDVLMPIEISRQESFVLHNEELLDEASQVLDEIQELTNNLMVIGGKEDKTKNALSKKSESSGEVESSLPEVVHVLAASYKLSETPVVWKDIGADKARIKRWLGIDVPDEFFDLGGLKQVVQFLDTNPTLNGKTEEKLKYEKLQLLSRKLLQLDVRTNYLKTFAGMCFIPLAIQNISAMEDVNIRIVVKVKTGETVDPDEHLIWEDYEGCQGLLCRDNEDENDVGVICELFCLDEDGIVHTEYPQYDPSNYNPKELVYTGLGFSPPDKTEEDYKQELEEFIASTGGRGYYEFEVERLRPGECRWLSHGMLIRPVNGEIKVHYQIHSTYSLGDLSGFLELKKCD